MPIRSATARREGGVAGSGSSGKTKGRGKAARPAKQTRMGRLRASNVDTSSHFYQERRRAIIAAGAQVFREHGFAASNFGMIAELLATDRASIYYYFGSKHELFHEVVREVAQESVTTAEAIATGPGNAPAKLDAAFQAVLETYGKSYPYMHVFLQENLAGKIDEDGKDWRVEGRDWAERYYLAIRRIIEQGVAEGSLRPVLPAGLMTMAAIGMANWAYRWYRPGGALSAHEIGAGFAQMLLEGIARPAGRAPAAHPTPRKTRG